MDPDDVAGLDGASREALLQHIKAQRHLIRTLYAKVVDLDQRGPSTPAAPDPRPREASVDAPRSQSAVDELRSVHRSLAACAGEDLPDHVRARLDSLQAQIAAALRNTQCASPTFATPLERHADAVLEYKQRAIGAGAAATAALDTPMPQLLPQSPRPRSGATTPGRSPLGSRAATPQRRTYRAPPLMGHSASGGAVVHPPDVLVRRVRQRVDTVRGGDDARLAYYRRPSSDGGTPQLRGTSPALSPRGGTSPAPSPRGGGAALADRLRRRYSPAPRTRSP